MTFNSFMNTGQQPPPPPPQPPSWQQAPAVLPQGQWLPPSLLPCWLAEASPSQLPTLSLAGVSHLPHVASFFLQDVFLSPKARLRQEDEEEQQHGFPYCNTTHCRPCAVRGVPEHPFPTRLVVTAVGLLYSCISYSNKGWDLNPVAAGACPVQEEGAAAGGFLLWLLGEGWGCPTA